MMKLTLLAFLFAGASAFTPVANKASSATTALKSTYENEPGATLPLGYWDPLKLTAGKDQELFDKARVGEVKNGRAAMLGVLGYVVPEIYRFPGDIYPGLKFADVPNGVAAIDAIPSMFWIATFFAIGAFDYTNSDRISGKFDPLPIGFDPETALTRESNEVNNGRLAMLGFWELVRHDITMQPGENLILGLPMIYDSY